MSFSRQFHCHDRRLAVPGGYSPTRTVEGPFLRCAMRLLSLAFSFGWTEVAKRLQAGAKAEHSFTSLDFCSFIYFFSFPRRDSPSIISFPLSSDSLAAQCSLPNVPPFPLPHLPTPRFARSLFFIVSFFPLLYLLFSHLFNVSRQPPAFLAFSVRRSVYTSASNNRKLCIVHERQYGIFVTVLVSFLLRRLLFTRFCERDEENKLLPARENASKIYTYFT